jgi:DNA-binding LacI/PurR family transcriptional regulator
VAIGSPVPGRACVRIDDRLALRTAVQHLAGLGHTKVGYIGSVPDNVAHIQTPQDRLEAFKASVVEFGLTCEPAWILNSDWTAEAAAQDSRDLLRGDDRPTAIVAASDEMAIGVRESARRLGMAVPGDLSDHRDRRLPPLRACSGLTTVRQDVAAQGHAAAELLLRALLHDDDDPTDEVVLPTELIVRESTGPLS